MSNYATFNRLVNLVDECGLAYAKQMDNLVEEAAQDWVTSINQEPEAQVEFLCMVWGPFKTEERIREAQAQMG